MAPVAASFWRHCPCCCFFFSRRGLCCCFLLKAWPLLLLPSEGIAHVAAFFSRHGSCCRFLLKAWPLLPLLGVLQRMFQGFPPCKVSRLPGLNRPMESGLIMPLTTCYNTHHNPFISTSSSLSGICSQFSAFALEISVRHRVFKRLLPERKLDTAVPSLPFSLWPQSATAICGAGRWFITQPQWLLPEQPSPSSSLAGIMLHWQQIALCTLCA